MLLTKLMYLECPLFSLSDNDDDEQNQTESG